MATQTTMTEEPIADDLKAWREQLIRSILRTLAILGFLALVAAACAEFGRGTEQSARDLNQLTHHLTDTVGQYRLEEATDEHKA